MRVHRNALLYLRSQEYALGAKQLVEQFAGILRTRLAPKSARLLLVDYAPEQVSLYDLLKHLESRGMGARLVDM